MTNNQPTSESNHFITFVMGFGKVDSLALEQIDFTLPRDHSGTTGRLAQLKLSNNKKTEILVGCAKWRSKE